jgi:hypothetical protein
VFLIITQCAILMSGGDMCTSFNNQKSYLQLAYVCNILSNLQRAQQITHYSLRFEAWPKPNNIDLHHYLKLTG